MAGTDDRVGWDTGRSVCLQADNGALLQQRSAMGSCQRRTNPLSEDAKLTDWRKPNWNSASAPAWLGDFVAFPARDGPGVGQRRQY
jgi:hypothetical protein